MYFYSENPASEIAESDPPTVCCIGYNTYLIDVENMQDATCEVIPNKAATEDHVLIPAPEIIVESDPPSVLYGTHLTDAVNTLQDVMPKIITIKEDYPLIQIAESDPPTVRCAAHSTRCSDAVNMQDDNKFEIVD